MKKLFTKFFAVMAMAIATGVSAFGQNGFSYQAVIRNAEGELITNKQVEVRFTLKHDGTNFYSEKQDVKTNEYGNIQVVVGNGEKLDGDFASVPWSSFEVKMEVAVDVDGKYITLGEVPVSGAPYAMYAQKAGGLTSKSANTKDGDALFAVNDANGNPVFAVFADGIVVYVDDTDAAKAKRSGFVVTGRTASKDNAATEYFSVTAEGTQIYVDDIAEDKAKRSGFVVTGRTASKDGEAADYLTVGGEGTTVFVDDDTSKAKRSGFVVTGRTASKDGVEPQYFSATTEGTTVYVDDTSADKAKRSGFVVTGRTATKGGDADNYLAVDGNGTQVYVDGADADKAKRSGFVVTGRTASKAEEDTLFAIEGGYTRVYVDDEETDKAKRSGFVVTGRTASKDSSATNYFNVSGEGNVEILTNEFAVTETNQASQETDTTAVQPQPGDTTETPAPVVEKPKSLFTVSSGNVQVGTEMVMMGDVAKKIEADTVSIDTVEAEFPQIAKIIDRADTVSCAAYKPFVYGNDSDSEGYALLGIYSKGNLAKVSATDARRNTVLLIDADGNVTKRQKYATVAVLMPEGDTQIYIRPLKATSQTISFGLMKKNATEPYQYVKVEAEIETSAGVPYKVVTGSNYGGQVVIDGTVAYGDQPTFEPVPMTGYRFVRWSDGNTRAKRTTTILDDYEISAEFERISYVVAVKSGNELFGTVSGEGTYWHGDTAYIEATPFTGYYFNNWSGVELNDSLQNSPSLALEVTSKLKLIANFGKAEYTITFDSDGGSAVAPMILYYQDKVTAPAEPTKIGYRFLDWEPQLPAEMPAENLTVKAMWSVKQFFIRFDSDGGTPVKTIEANYSEAVTAPEAPTKEGHTFAGWSDTIPATMPANDIKIKALWTVNKYALTWVANGGQFADGDTVAVDSVDYGKEITLRNDITREGYTFVGWDTVPATMPAEGTICTAQWSLNSHNIIYVVDGKMFQTDSAVAYGTEIKPIAAPTKEGYTFSGWKFNGKDELPKTMPDSTVTITGSFTVNRYTIRFETEGGSAVDSIMADYGTVVVAPKEPTKEGYTFAGWKPEVPATMPAEGTICTAQWSLNAHNIIYVVDGKMFQTDSAVAYGTEIKPIAAPTKEGYTFSGWKFNGKDELPKTMPDSTVTITGSFTVNQYTIKFETDGGSAVDSIMADYGTVVAAPKEPTKEGYTFAGWKPEVPATMPAEGTICTAQWSLNSHNIIYVVDGVATDTTKNVAYGTEIKPIAAPEKTGYTFGGWKFNGKDELPKTMPDSTVTITGSFTVNRYTIRFETDGGSAVDSIMADYGTAVVAPKEPTKEGYTFAGWKPEVPATMPANVTICTAQWSLNAHNIIYVVDGVATDTVKNVAYGTAIEPIAAPERAGYTFGGWKFNGKDELPKTMPDSTVTITGIFTVNRYTIRFETEGGSAVDSIMADYGTAVVAPKAPTKEGYTFAGWKPDVPATMPAEGTICTAQWSLNAHNIIYVVDGVAIDTTKNVAYGTEIKPIAAPEKTGYVFSGWQNVPRTMPDSTITISGKFTAGSVTLTFTDENGENPIVIAGNYGDTVQMPDEPKREGYTFAGWSPAVPSTMPAEDATYKATWTLNKMAVSVTATKGGDVEWNNRQYYYGDTLSAKAVASTGYYFANWSGVALKDNTQSSFEVVVKQQLDIVANFVVRQFTATFVRDAGDTTRVKANFGDSLKIETEPAKTGYTFQGWNPEVPATMPAEDMTFTAQWKVNQYTIKFETDGGSAVDSIKADYGTAVVAPEAPTKEGYTFAGWKPEVPAMMPANGTVCTAQWSLNAHTVTYFVDSVQYGKLDTLDFGAAITLRAIPTKAGYTFIGWKFNGTDELPKTMPDSDVVFTGSWKANDNTEYTVNLFFQNVDNDNYGEPALKSFTLYGTTGAMTDYKPVDSLGFTVQTVTQQVISGDGQTRLNVYYNRNSYQLTWSANGGEFENGKADSVVTVAYGDTVVAPKTAPTMKGYTFAGWSDTLAMMPANAMTIAAQWTVNEHTLTYMIGGKQDGEVETLAFGTTITPRNVDAREGYTFSGWKYNGTDELPTAMPDSNVVFTGSWSANEISYIVEHWQADLSGEYIILAQRDTLIGNAGAQTDAKATQFTGFEAQTFSNSEIGTADYKTTVTINYKRLSYTLTWDANGGTINGKSDSTQTLQFGAPIVPPTVERTGYDFSSWGGLEVETMPASNLSVIALWGAGEVTYTVEHKGEGLDGEYIVLGTDTQTGTTGEETQAAPKEFPGFTAQQTISQQTIAADGKTVVEILYTRNPYNLIWNANGGTMGNGKDTAMVKVKYGAAISKPANPIRKGYSFNSWTPVVPATMPAKDTTFIAKWDTLAYSITFKDTAGSTFAMENPIVYTVNDTIEIQNPDKDGYTFTGWTGGKWTEATKDIVIKNDTGSFTLKANWSADVTLYKVLHKYENLTEGYTVEIERRSGLTGSTTTAQPQPRTGFTAPAFADIQQQTIRPGSDTTTIEIIYTRNSYYLTWNANGGTVAGGGETVVVNYAYEAEVATKGVDNRDGYTFKGWSGTLATMPAKDTTLTAKWDTIEYTITFNSNGGSSVAAIKAKYNTDVTTPDAPTRTGYTFKGWATIADGTAADVVTVESKMPFGGATYYAVWAVNPYTITFDSNGGSTVASITDDYNAAVTAPDDPTRTGYTFKGWSPEVPTTMPVNGETCVAQWELVPYTITYNLAGGSVATENPESYTVVSADIKLNNPTRTGYNFAGWTGTDLTEATTAVTIASGSTGDRAYTATWAAISYTITATANPAEGGTVTGGGSYDYNGTAPLKATPATGYDFTGWDDGVKDSERTISIKGAASYVANFSKKTFTVTATANDAAMGSVTVSGTDADNKCEYGSTVTLSATANEGYHFVNWNGKDELNEATISFSATKDSTLTANFAINTYTITFKNGETELQSTEVEYGQMPEYAGETPTKATTEQYTYEFSGWDKELAAATGNATYTAQFRSYADLGLTSGNRWATTNVGASSPADYGDYFAWGETEPYYAEGHALDESCSDWRTIGDREITGYNWASYTKLSNGSGTTLTKYCNDASKGYENYTDTLTILQSADDAATANWGSGCAMPTTEDWSALGSECYWEWTASYNGTGVKGYIVYKALNETDKGKKVKSGGTPLDGYSTAAVAHIFLPAAGYRSNESLNFAGSYGRYWSASLYTSNPNGARYCYFLSSDVSPSDDYDRFYGQSVRPVKKPKAISYYINSGMGDYTDHTGLTAELALPNINSALAKMNDRTANYTIIINGKLTGNQGLGDTLNTRARRITICGLTGNTADSLYGNNSGTVLTINTTVPVTVKNLKISGGNSTKGGGIYCYAGSNVTLDNGAKVAGNSAQEKGGGAYVDGTIVSGDTIRGKLTINELAEISNNKVVVTHSSGDDGGAGVYVNYGMMLLNGGEISNNYHGNSYNSTTVNGRGGIRLQNAIFTIRDGKVSGNKSGHMGGNIFAVASRIDMLGGEISDGVIGYNTSSYDAVGGALLLDINSVMNMSGGKITGNKTMAGQSKNGLGAVVVTSASIFNMSGGTISGNTIVSGNRMGSAVSVVGNGVFNISDSAYIASDNDVYLNSGRIINITAPLDSASVATITPQKYTTNQTILSGDATLIASQCTKFAVTPQINGSETISWSISPDGNLLKADYVPVQGAYFDGSQRVDTSRVFIEGRQLAIQDLYACDHEVTQSEWYNVMGVTQEEIYSVNNFGRDNSNPVYYVGWYDAIAYCNKLSIREGLEPVYTVNGITDWTELQYSQIPTESNSDWNASTCDFNKNGYRLPTEAEWEYLARGGSNWDSYRYSGSNDSATVAWTVGSGSTHAVKTKQANTLGIYDMSGNVWEWVWDTTLTTGNNHIKCGGSWDYPAVYSSPTSRFYSPPLAGPYTGFRVVRTASNTDTCIITFNTNGGTAIAPMTVWRGYRLDVKPVNGTLNFGGWYTDSELTKPFDDGSVVTSDTTLYAKWLSDFIEVPGTYFSGAEAVANSVVFVKDTQILIRDLYACDHEVTQSEWYDVMNVPQEQLFAADSGRGPNYPVYNISWYDAIAYCNKLSLKNNLEPVYSVNGVTNWLGLDYADIPTTNNADWNAAVADYDKNGYRLPTEAEWEYLARGGSNWDSYRYSGSNSIDSVAWHNYNSAVNGKSLMHEVKTKKANSLGLYDMSGSTWEWCSDKRKDTVNVRGGSLKCNPLQYSQNDWCAVHRRGGGFPYTKTWELGFRVVRTAKPLYAVVGNVLCPDMNSTLTAILNATDSIGVIIFGSVRVSELGAASNSNTIIWAIKNTTAPKVSLVVPEGANIVLTSYYCKWMFSGCEKLVSADLRGFNTENVTDMSNMFFLCKALTTLDLSSFKTANVTKMSSMFGKCSSLTTLDLSSFNTENVTDMSSMFFYCEALTTLDVSGFKTANVTTMDSMFAGCEALTTLDLSSFNTAKVKNMVQMFFYCSALTTLDLSSFNTDSVTTMNDMFESCKALTSLDLSGFSTANVTTMDYMFKECDLLTTIYAADGTDWNKDGLSSHYMFNDCPKLVGGNGTNYKFSNASDATYAHIDGGQDNPGYFTEVYARVNGKPCANKDSVIAAIGRATDTVDIVLTSHVTASDLGKGGYSPSGIIGAIRTNDKSGARFRLVVPEEANIVLSGDVCQEMFLACEKLVSADLRGFNTENVSSMFCMFQNCSALATLDISSFKTGGVNNMSAMFSDCSSLTNIDVSGFNTSNVTNMNGMFDGCTSITTLDVSSFNTEALYSANGMFQGCSRLTTIYAAAGANWYKEYLDEDADMFGGSSNLVGGNNTGYDAGHADATRACIDGLNGNEGYFTQKYATVGGVICKDKAATIDSILHATDTVDVVLTGAVTAAELGKADTEGTIINAIKNCNKPLRIVVPAGANIVLSGTDCEYMFSECMELVSADLRGFNTENVTAMNSMFESCFALTSLNLSSFNTSKVEVMYSMFSECDALTTLDLSSFNTESVTDMNSMFSACTALNTIYVANGADWSGAFSEHMFESCDALVGGNNTAFSSANTDGTYARVDGLNGQPGYFTSNTVSYYVNPSMNGTTGLTPDDALPTLGDALSKIVNAGNSILNYTINISGTVTGNVILSNYMDGKAQSITLCGTDNTTDILDGNGGSGLHLQTTVPVTVKNLKITGGNTGSGIHISSGSSVTLADGALVEGNTYDGRGSGVFVSENAKFVMMGSAKVAADNEVYLQGNSVITIGGPLTADTAAVVTPSSYAERTQVLELAMSVTSTKLAWECGRFVITPNNGNYCYVLFKGEIIGSNEIDEENDAEHPYILKTDTRRGSPYSPQVYIANYVTNATADRSYYITLRDFKRESPQWAGSFSFNNYNANTTFTYNVTLEGSSDIKGNGYPGIHICDNTDAGTPGNIKLVFGATTTGTVSFIDKMSYSNDFQVRGTMTGELTFEVAPGCSFAGTVGTTTYTDITEFFTAAASHKGGSTMTITRWTQSWMEKEGDHYYVDLGLTSGTLWATTNVGATLPQSYGDYIAWSETEPLYATLDPLTWKEGKDTTGYSWVNFPTSYTSPEGAAASDDNQLFTKYNDTDGKTILDPEDDAATVNWGSGWVTPTPAEACELLTECYWVWTTNYNGTGATGYIVYKSVDKSKDYGTMSNQKVSSWKHDSGHTYSPSTDAHIFLPVAGRFTYQSVVDPTIGFFMTASPSGRDAQLMQVGSSLTQYGYGYPRRTGFSVRPVKRVAPIGAIKGKFSVGADKRVYFSQGNLQYQASTGTWRFAENQYDTIGALNANISSSYTGWIDLFGWGTSGWNSGATAYQPWSVSTTQTDYLHQDFTGQYANADWGVQNPISNGGNKAGQWRTLTNDEWNYLIEHANKGFSSIDGVTGLVILPDGNNETIAASYTTDAWMQMEAKGSVFLPTAGSRNGSGSTSVYDVGSFGRYWSATTHSGGGAYHVYFSSDDNNGVQGGELFRGFSVRLVRDK